MKYKTAMAGSWSVRQRVAHERRKLVLGQSWSAPGAVAAWARMVSRI